MAQCLVNCVLAHGVADVACFARLRPAPIQLVNLVKAAAQQHKHQYQQ